MDAAKSVTASFALNTYTLSVSKAGTGSGTVTSVPAGIDCGGDCSQPYDYNTVVTLSAAASTGSTFSGWSGAGCSGTGTCQVTMDAAKSVTASFTLSTYTLSVSKAGTGSGTVTSVPAGIDCGGDCSQPYDYNTVVTLSAAASTGSTFSGWSGAGCSGTGTCQVTMNAAKSVTANFSLITLMTYELTMAVDPVGGGTTNPAVGVHTYPEDTVVDITAAPAAGYLFDHWSGACTSAGACQVTMDADKTVTAHFTEITYVIFLPLIMR
jgi:uncharacterized repeat protein (TIGR02543 family)